MKRFAILVLGVVLIASVTSHGALVDPIPRNAVDREQVQLKGKYEGGERCACANSTGQCHNGQACYWYSQGCFIGCPTCDSISGRVQEDVCGGGKKATLNDPNLRTVNRNATPGSELDIYRHNPWRAPGSAPVVDSCGLAGGTPWAANVSEWGDYVPTTHAKHGDFGSRVLPEMDSGKKWQIGSEVEVIWQIRANHGGGYSYRLCPADQPITEACFQANPLDFNEEKQQILFSNGTRQAIKGGFIRNGTIPPNSHWSMNPIPPRCLGPGCAPVSQTHSFCQPCPLPIAGRDFTSCDNTPDPTFDPPCNEGDRPGICSGNQPTQWGSVGVIDVVKIPSYLKPGKYVLGWRLDCESTAQVWSNCADIQLVPSDEESGKSFIKKQMENIMK